MHGTNCGARKLRSGESVNFQGQTGSYLTRLLTEASAETLDTIVVRYPPVPHRAPCTRLQSQVGATRAPLHGLLLDKALAHHLIDRGLDETGHPRRRGSEPLACNPATAHRKRPLRGRGRP